MKFNQLKNKQGFTLIELSIVLVIIGVVLAGVFVTASSAMNNNKKQQLLQEAVQIVQNAKNLFSNSSDASTFDTTTLINSGAAPAQYVSGSTIRHPFTVTANTDKIIGDKAADGNGGFNFTISFDGIPQDACVQLITNIAGSQDLMSKNVIQGVGVVGGANAGGAVTTFAQLTNTNTGTTAPNAGNIATACNQNDSSKKVSVGFSFQP